MSIQREVDQRLALELTAAGLIRGAQEDLLTLLAGKLDGLVNEVDALRDDVANLQQAERDRAA